MMFVYLSLQPTSNGGYEEKMKSAAASLVNDMVVLDQKIDWENMKTNNKRKTAVRLCDGHHMACSKKQKQQINLW